MGSYCWKLIFKDFFSSLNGKLPIFIPLKDYNLSYENLVEYIYMKNLKALVVKRTLMNSRISYLMGLACYYLTD